MYIILPELKSISEIIDDGRKKDPLKLW